MHLLDVSSPLRPEKDCEPLVSCGYPPCQSLSRPPTRFEGSHTLPQRSKVRLLNDWAKHNDTLLHSNVMSRESILRSPLVARPRALVIELPVMKKSLREQHAEETREAILAAARKLFTAKGYDTSSIDDIAAEARVTSGALYHHFLNKREIMRAVFEMLEGELKNRIVITSRRAKTADAAVRLTLRALFEACLEDDIRSIIFEQAPRVLGWEEWRSIDAEYAMELLLALLSRLRKERKLGWYDDKLIASLFLGALAEAGLQIAQNRSSVLLRSRCEKILRAFLRGLQDP